MNGSFCEPAEFDEIHITIMEDLKLKNSELPNRVPTIMQYASGLIHNKFEVELIEWAKSDMFNKTFYDPNSWEQTWQNKSAALSQSKLINLIYGYICTKKIWLQSLITLLERAKKQLDIKKEASYEKMSRLEKGLFDKELGSIKQHLLQVHTAYEGLDNRLLGLLKDIFGKPATRETVVKYATLQAMPSFGGMMRNYKTLAGTDPKYLQPKKGADVCFRARRQLETCFTQHQLHPGTPRMERYLHLREDKMYPGCFNLVFPSGCIWEAKVEKLEAVKEATLDKIADSQRYIFIGINENNSTWYYITTRAIVMDVSSELKAFMHFKYKIKGDAYYTVQDCVTPRDFEGVVRSDDDRIETPEVFRSSLYQLFADPSK